MITKITNVEEVVAFAKHLFQIEKLSVHPDDDFKNYVINETMLPKYTDEEADIYNNLMKQCFIICENEDIDIYEIFYNEIEHLLV